jgi:hypothetical protein
MTRSKRIVRSLPTLSALLPLAFSAAGADKPAAAAAADQWKKPAWFSDLSFTVKEGYDDNLFGVSGDGSMDEKSSWITTVSPKIGFNFVPLLGEQQTWQTLSFVYAPDFVTFHQASDESYNAHRINTAVKGKVGAVTMTVDNAFLWNDGDKTAPTYTAPDNQRSAYATAMPRERRRQIQDRAKISFQYDLEKFFIRPTASLLYYDLGTDLMNVAGYQNYADRYDVNGGVDFGYKLNPQLSLFVGYRYGHQYQDQYSWSMLSCPSDYQRILFGIEGKPQKWLTVSLVGGPDFRNYEANSASHTTPIDDPDMVTYYLEGNTVAEITPKDTLTLKTRGWQWVSSTGSIAYFDSSYDLSYRRKWTSKLTMDLGARLATSDYTESSGASALRDDWQYTLSAGLGYAFNSHCSMNLAYALDMGRNNQDKLAAGQTEKYREFNHQLVSLSGTIKF